MKAWQNKLIRLLEQDVDDALIQISSEYSVKVEDIYAFLLTIKAQGTKYYGKGD